MSLLIWDAEYAHAVTVTKDDDGVLFQTDMGESIFGTTEEFHDWFYGTFVFWGVADMEDLELVERWLGLDE